MVFPLVIVVILGLVDASLVMFDYASATKATYAGARFAVTNDPVASTARFDLSSYSAQSSYSGRYCFSSADGTADSTASCPSVNVTCTGGTTSGSCTGNAVFNDTVFTKIFKTVQDNYPYRTLDRQQLQISYVTTNLGYVGQQNFAGDAGELPMNVTLQLRCLTHRFFFVGPLVKMVFPSLPSSCAGITTGTDAGVIMPPFSTTLPSEDLTTN